VQSFTDSSLTECPACSGNLRKVFSSVGIVFKGSGFYRTDSRSGGGGVTAKSDSDKSDSGRSDSGKSESGSSSNGSSSNGSKDGSPAKSSSASAPAAAAS
jgi:hypothetical protein